MTRKQQYTITLDQGWYTAKEMRDDLGWSEFEPQLTAFEAPEEVVT